MFTDLSSLLNPINILDIAIVAFVTYKIMVMLKGTRAVQLIKGIVLLMIISVISELLGLTTVNWILVQARTVLLIAIPLVFQPELRRGLEQLGKGSLWNPGNKASREGQFLENNVNAIVRCVVEASKQKTGVLIAIKRDVGLGEYVDTGIKINGQLSAELLSNIFIVNTPLHDGAVIVEEDKILAASCYLPLSESQTISKELGTRHRAAIGLSEATDAVIVVVSEETGGISIADAGSLTRELKEGKLKDLLVKKLYKPKTTTKSIFANWREK